MPQTIALKGDYIAKEREASATITPGNLIELQSTGFVRNHSVLGGPAQKAFALENDLIGKGITDDYVNGDLVRYGVFPAGAEVYARVSEAVTTGDFLESAADGRLQTQSTPVENSGVAIALETVGGAGRAKVEVL